jgi:hypothetical protein
MRKSVNHPARPARHASVPLPDLATDVATRVERSLKHRVAREGTRTAKVEVVAKKGGAKLWGVLRKRPSVGVIATGGAAFLLANAIGVGELAIAVVAGYAAYEVLRRRVPVKTAIRDAVKEIERGV